MAWSPPGLHGFFGVPQSYGIQDPEPARLLTVICTYDPQQLIGVVEFQDCFNCCPCMREIKDNFPAREHGTGSPGDNVQGTQVVPSDASPHFDTCGLQILLDPNGNFQPRVAWLLSHAF